MHVAREEPRQRRLLPPPARQRRRVELEPSARRREAAPHDAVDAHAGRAPPLRIAVRRPGRREVDLRRRRRPRVHPPEAILRQILELARRHLFRVDRTDVLADLDGAVAPHPLQRRQPFGRRLLRQPRHGVGEDVAVVLVDRLPLAGALDRLHERANPQRPIPVDAPRQLEPELVLFPHLAGVGLARVGDLLPLPFCQRAQHRLAEAEPLPRLRLVRVRVVPLGRVAHGQDVVGEVGGLAPRRRQRHVQPDLRLVLQHLDPGEAVGVGPHRVVDAREVDLEPAAPLLHQMRQQERQLVHRERVLDGPVEVVPLRRVARQLDRLGDELGPGVEVGAAGRAHRAEERVDQEQRARHLPAALVAGRGAAPGMGRERGAGARDHLGDLAQRRGIDARLLGGALEGEVGVERRELALERLEGLRQLRPLGGEPLLPVPPATHEVAVVAAGGDQVVRDRQVDRRLRARLRRQPPVGVRRGVRQARVEHDDLGAALPSPRRCVARAG